MLKKLVQLVVSFGVGTVVKASIDSLTKDATKMEKVGVAIGSFVISGMVTDAACKYADEQVDEMIKMIKAVEVDEKSDDPEVEVQ